MGMEGKSEKELRMGRERNGFQNREKMQTRKQHKRWAENLRSLPYDLRYGKYGSVRVSAIALHTYVTSGGHSTELTIFFILSATPHTSYLQVFQQSIMFD